MNMYLRERPSHVRTFELIETQALRQRMEAAIEILLATLDALDGDDGLEPDNDNEPSLGWAGEGRGCSALGYDHGDDRELDDADDEDGRDRETVCEDEGAQCDDEGVPDFGIADRDGLLEVVAAGALGEWLL